MAFPEWRTTPQLSPGDLMVDRVQLVCRGEYAFASPVLKTDVIAHLARGRTPFEGRLPRGFRWADNGAGRLRLRRAFQHHGWLVGVELSLGDPTAARPERVAVTATIDINPTRIRALAPHVHASETGISRVALAVAETSRANPLDNQLSIAELLHPGAPYHRVDDAALILDGAVALVGQSLFSARPSGQPPTGRGQFNTVSIRQIEIYCDLRADDPVRQVQDFFTGVQSGSRTEFKRVIVGDEDGYRTVTVPQLPIDTTNAVFYSRGHDRIRAEVRYLRNASRAVRGSTTGDTRQRLRTFADDAARRLNRILRSTSAHRREHRLVGYSSFGELAAVVSTVITTYERRREVINQLCRFRHISVGNGRLAMITTQEAGRLVRREVLIRAPNRSRDTHGTIFGLHWRFPHLPGGIAPDQA